MGGGGDCNTADEETLLPGSTASAIWDQTA